MKKDIFRKKSIDRINSPEMLNDYTKVANPSIWFILIGILLLINGGIILGILVTVDTNVEAVVEVKDGSIVAYIDEADIDKIKYNMNIAIEGTNFPIVSVAERPIKNNKVDEYVLHKGNMESSDWLYPVNVQGNLRNGVYAAKIVIDQSSVLSYLFN